MTKDEIIMIASDWQQEKPNERTVLVQMTDESGDEDDCSRHLTKGHNYAICALLHVHALNSQKFRACLLSVAAELIKEHYTNRTEL